MGLGSLLATFIAGFCGGLTLFWFSKYWERCRQKRASAGLGRSLRAAMDGVSERPEALPAWGGKPLLFLLNALRAVIPQAPASERAEGGAEITEAMPGLVSALPCLAAALPCLAAAVPGIAAAVPPLVAAVPGFLESAGQRPSFEGFPAREQARENLQEHSAGFRKLHPAELPLEARAELDGGNRQCEAHARDLEAPPLGKIRTAFAVLLLVVEFYGAKVGLAAQGFARQQIGRMAEYELALVEIAKLCGGGGPCEGGYRQAERFFAKILDCGLVDAQGLALQLSRCWPR